MLPEPFTPQFLSQLETFRLRTRKEFLGSHPGSYSAPRRGTSLELADQLRQFRRPGKAILISDFLVPTVSYQQALNLLRAFNLDISVIQVLSRREVDPSFPSGSLALVDSESQAEIKCQWDSSTRKSYQARLAQHNLQIRSFCHQSGIHYSLYVTDRNLDDFILATLPAIGLFK